MSRVLGCSWLMLFLSAGQGSPDSSGYVSDPAMYAQGDVARGRSLYGSCAACHGAEGTGNRTLGAPALAGQNFEYLVRQLRHFKSGVRGGEDDVSARMQSAASVLPDDLAIADVARFIETLPKAPQLHTVVGDSKQGERLFYSCMMCHGLDASGIPEIGFPNLRNLPDWYLVRQIGLFASKRRGTHENDTTGQLMQSSVRSLWDEQDALDVTAYLTGPKK